ncbi:MAG TPA: bifunctional oligoribonuclease/PAP phosphatase NrnA [Geobacteraceae bacterium]|nr:bifunctional oligoribonuclease/PAP phosphatase NrnA [Geobacteraceae bacterium]
MKRTIWMLKKINELIATGRSFLVTTHEGPDGDAVGSSLALANYLRELGKDVTVHICDPVPEIYSFLPLSGEVTTTLPERDYDVCFVLDVGEFRRAGAQVAAASGRIGAFVNLDHHKTRDEFGLCNLIDPTAASTGILVYRLIREAGHEVSPATALCIYVATITDTGSFRYSNANPEAFAVAGEMIAKGVNAWDVSAQLYESQPRQRLELLALALATLTFSDCGKFAALTVTLEMYAQTAADAELTDGFINYPRSIRGVEVAIFFRQLSETAYKVGFRSKGLVDVSQLAEGFGGGGHHNAAGCVVEGNIEEVREKVFAHLRSAL